MKQTWILILVIIIMSCDQKRKGKNTDSEVINTDSKAIPVESDGGIGDGALSIANHVTQNIEKAHKKEEFSNHDMVSFKLDLSFGGKQRFDGKITMLTNSAKIRIDKKDGSSLIFNGENVYLQPVDANDKGARFDMFTWTYFFGLPYKLSDPGTHIEIDSDRKINDRIYTTSKLTFAKETGDAPDDWYILFSDPKKSILHAAAYIVTYGSSDIKKAEEDPHIIIYKDFKNIEGIPFATKWGFYGWTEKKGVTDQLGEATISDITFLEKEASLFDDPSNSKIINK